MNDFRYRPTCVTDTSWPAHTFMRERLKISANKWTSPSNSRFHMVINLNTGRQAQHLTATFVCEKQQQKTNKQTNKQTLISANRLVIVMANSRQRSVMTLNIDQQTRLIYTFVR